jgi:hypothetical protein
MQLANNQLPALQLGPTDVLSMLTWLSDLVPTQLAAPNVTVTAQGVTGSTTCSYIVAALSVAGMAPSAAISVTTGNAAQTAANFNQITWGAVPNALGYAVYRTAGGASQGLIALVPPSALQRPAVGNFGYGASYFQINDTGIVATAASANGPTANTTGCLQLPAPIFSASPIMDGPLPATLSTAGAQTLTVAQMVAPILVRSGNSTAVTDTTPTAAQMVAALQGVQAGCTFQWMIRNLNTGSGTHTLAAGSGVTLAAGNTNTTAISNTHSWLVVFTNVTPGSEAVTIYSLGSALVH